MFMHALVTTDGSALARAALEYVSSVVRSDDCATTMEVIDDASRLLAKNAGFGFTLASTMGLDLADDVIAGERLAAEINLEAARRGLNDAGIPSVETFIRQGAPGDLIVAAARCRWADIHRPDGDAWPCWV